MGLARGIGRQRAGGLSIHVSLAAEDQRTPQHSSNVLRCCLDCSVNYLTVTVQSGFKMSFMQGQAGLFQVDRGGAAWTLV